MEIRGTIRRIFTPVYKQPGTFSEKLVRARQFFRDRRTAALEPLLWPLAFVCSIPFVNMGGVLPPLFSVYALTRLLTLETGDPRGWRKAAYYPMVANGLVPLAPLANRLPAEPFFAFASQMGLIDLVPPNLVPPAAVFPEVFISYLGIPVLLAAAGLARYAYCLAVSGKVVKDLASAAIGEDSKTVAAQFLGTENRIVLKTMREIRRTDAGKFMEILESMKRAEVVTRRMQKLIDKLEQNHAG